MPVCKMSHGPDFDWNDLRSFLSVVRTGRLTAAALRLGIDHSTLSRRIASLEAALQVRLFDRLPTGYVLTPAGVSLVEQAEAIENIAIRISSRLSESGTKLAGSIRIATPEGFGTYFLAQHLHFFADQYPKVKLELVANPNVVSLTKREADLAVTMARPKTGPLRARKLTNYEYGLYGLKAILAKRTRSMCIRELKAYRLIGYIPDLLPTPAHDYLKEIVGTRNADLEVSNILTQLAATIDGYGLCVLPCYMADTHPELMRILSAEICFTRSYWLVTHSEARAPARVMAMTKFLVDAVEANRSQWLPTAHGSKSPIDLE